LIHLNPPKKVGYLSNSYKIKLVGNFGPVPGGTGNSLDLSWLSFLTGFYTALILFRFSGIRQQQQKKILNM
jgi:hypothetical protein